MSRPVRFSKARSLQPVIVGAAEDNHLTPLLNELGFSGVVELDHCPVPKVNSVIFLVDRSQESSVKKMQEFYKFKLVLVKDQYFFDALKLKHLMEVLSL